MKTNATVCGFRSVLTKPRKPLCLYYCFFGVRVCDFFVAWVVLQRQEVSTLNCIKLVDCFIFIFSQLAVSMDLLKMTTTKFQMQQFSDKGDRGNI